MRKNYLILFVLFIILSPLSAKDDTSLYINGLEAIIEENESEAKESFSELIDLYPSSKYQFNASNYLFDLNNAKDNSGIVPFYLNNIATITYTAFGINSLLEIEQDTLTIGLTGLAGVGGGLGLSSLLAKDYEITKELFTRMATNQTVAMGNYYYLQGILYDQDLIGDTATEDKIVLASQLATLNGSLYLSYFGLRDKELEKGKGFFGFQSYAWANYYYWLSTLLFEMDDTTTQLGLAMGISDLAYIGSFPLWDKLQWSGARSGLVSVGGIGGALIGLFTNLIVENFVTLDVKQVTSIVLGGTLLGQAYSVYLTRNMGSNRYSKIADNNLIMPYPIIKANNEYGIGFHTFI
ncbi:MAG: hypothetical protein ACPKM0_13055 [Pleomorphochaeta sp.]